MKSYALIIVASCAACATTTTTTIAQQPSRPQTADAANASAPQRDRVTINTLVALERSLRPQDPQRPVMLLRIANEALALAADERGAMNGADSRAPWPTARERNDNFEGERNEVPARVAPRDPAALARLTASERSALERYDRAMAVAVVVLEQRLQQYPTAPQSDEAQFTLAFTLSQWNLDANAAYYALIRRYPESPWTANAWLHFGDYYFEREAMDQASIAYERAINVPGSRVAPYATFKLAWVRMNQSRFDEAANTFVQAIERARQGNALAIIREAARDLSLALVQTPNRAPRAIVEALVAAARGDGSLLDAMLDRAMNHLRDTGHGPVAVALWEASATHAQRWVCLHATHANEAAGGDASLVARVAALSHQLQCQ